MLALYHCYTKMADPTAPMPLFVVLHGYTGYPEVFVNWTMMTTVADDLGFAVIFPRGIDAGAGSGWAFPGCNSVPDIGTVDTLCNRSATCGPNGFAAGCNVSLNCPSNTAIEANEGCGTQFTANATCSNPSTNCNWCGCSDDAGFIRDLTMQVMDIACIDRARVYMTGMSAGGMFASWLSSQLADIFAGFAPVAGANPLGFFEYDSQLQSQLGLAAMPVRLWFSGLNDIVVPPDGSPSYPVPPGEGGTSWYVQAVVINCLLNFVISMHV